MRKLLSIIVVLIMIANCISVYADDSQLISQPITSIWTEATVRSALLEYFNSREAFLNQELSTIKNAVAPIISDESSHLQTLLRNNICSINSTVIINELGVYSNVAMANVTESITYHINGSTTVCVIEHTLTLTHSEAGEILVDSDAYYDTSCDFYSASFVRESDAELLAAQPGGRSCIANIALGEEGYTEGSNNYTKYGVWYGTPNNEWCVIFVSWCAYQANISESVIPKASGTGTFRSHFCIDSDDITPQYGGTAEPQVGDIFMFASTTNPGGVSHVGIVTSVGSSTIQIVHGNYPSSVLVQTISKTDTRLYAYGTPSYGSNHALTTTWTADFDEHWHVCSICGDTFGYASHTYVYQEDIAKYVCSVCGYTTSFIPGTA